MLFLDTKISGYNFHFNQCLLRKIQDIALTVLYKDDEQLRQIGKMRSVLACISKEYR